MFEYLLVVASTLIYFRVFHYEPEKRCVATQTEPWFPTNILDFMDDDMSYESSSSLEMLPMLRQRAHGLKESPPMTE